MTTLTLLNRLTAPEIIESIAAACHEQNRAYSASIGGDPGVPWAEAPADQRASSRAGVLAVLRGEVTQPQDSHDAWATHKFAEGWKYGPQKDAAAKTHPSLLPYSALPAAERCKDYLFLATVRQHVTALKVAWGEMDITEFHLPSLSVLP